MTTAFRPLPTQFTESGWNHLQIWRSDSAAVYKRWKETSPRPHFEAIRISKNAAGERFGGHFEACESYPTERQWGDNGWSYDDQDEAMAKAGTL